MRRVFSWEVVEGCVKLSAGCKNCYAEDINRDFHTSRMRDDKLLEPTIWPVWATITVCDEADLFQEAVTDEFILKVMDIIDKSEQTFILLTKRAERMASILGSKERKNCWVGVSAEDQEKFDERVPFLNGINSKVRFASLQPLLGPITIDGASCLDWIVTGSEYGKAARYFDEKWVENIYQETVAMNIPMLYRQKMVDGVKVMNPLLNGERISEYPRVRVF